MNQNTTVSIAQDIGGGIRVGRWDADKRFITITSPTATAGEADVVILLFDEAGHFLRALTRPTTGDSPTLPRELEPWAFEETTAVRPFRHRIAGRLYVLAPDAVGDEFVLQPTGTRHPAIDEGGPP